MEIKNKKYSKTFSIAQFLSKANRKWNYSLSSSGNIKIILGRICESYKNIISIPLIISTT